MALGQFKGSAHGDVLRVGGETLEQARLQPLGPIQPGLGDGNLAGKTFLHAYNLRPAPSPSSSRTQASG
jgi:hypothetical protein